MPSVHYEKPPQSHSSVHRQYPLVAEAAACGPPELISCGVIVRLDTLTGLRVRRAHRRDSVFHWDADRARVGAKIFIEGAVLLHDDDDMLDILLRQRQVIGSGLHWLHRGLG